MKTTTIMTRPDPLKKLQEDHERKKNKKRGISKRTIIIIIGLILVFGFISEYEEEAKKDEANKKTQLRKSTGKILNQRDLGLESWPLTVSIIQLYCEELSAYGSRAVYFTATTDKTTFYDYALNGTARGAKIKLNLRDVSELLAEGWTDSDLAPLLREGLNECPS
ncbi:MAG: hypothetical protein V3T30_04080 [Thermodesulfobacteriota bacterium]